MFKFFSDPNHLLALGIFFTMVGVIATGAGTIRTSRIQAREQSELKERADAQAESQRRLREQSDEIAALNRQIADSQTVLREKADKQTDMQRQLTEKSEENALLNSQMTNLQRDLREKAEDQIESQHLLRDKVEENALLNSQMANLQREQNQVIHEIKSAITDMNNALIGQGILKAEMPEKGKSVQLQVQGIASKMTLGTPKIFLSSTNIIVLNGQTEHIFDGDLSISVKINSSGSKGRPFLHAMLVSPGKNIGKIDTDEIGYCTTYEKYSIKINSISAKSANLKISIDDACSK